MKGRSRLKIVKEDDLVSVKNIEGGLSQNEKRKTEDELEIDLWVHSLVRVALEQMECLLY